MASSKTSLRGRSRSMASFFARFKISVLRRVENIFFSIRSEYQNRSVQSIFFLGN